MRCCVASAFDIPQPLCHLFACCLQRGCWHRYKGSWFDFHQSRLSRFLDNVFLMLTLSSGVSGDGVTERHHIDSCTGEENQLTDDAPWMRRVIGNLVNEFAAAQLLHAHAVFKATSAGDLAVNVPAPLYARAEPQGSRAFLEGREGWRSGH
jgi:hypothetical protein